MGKKYKCGVYQITNNENLKIYIGSSKQIEKRWKAHIRELNNNKHSNKFLQEDWNKYGEKSFKFEILEETDEDLRWNVEQEYLEDLIPFYRNGNGYNINEHSEYRNSTSLRLHKHWNDDGMFDYYIAKVKGLRGMLIDIDVAEELTREEIEMQCWGVDTYYDMQEYILEMGGYDDDWC